MERSRIPIGQFATWTGLSTKALRLYAESGLLSPARIDPDTGYRSYGLDQVERARMIRLLRAVDMPLAEIRDFLAAPSREGLAAHRRALAARQDERERVLLYLDRLLDPEEATMAHDVTLKEIPAQPYIGRTRTVSIGELDAFLSAAIGELRGSATPAGAPFSIFHSPITDEADGEIEVDLPVAAEGESTRSLPAGLVASTVVEGSATDYPEILGAYDAVAMWAKEQGHELAGPPREIYLSDHVAGWVPKMEIALPVR